MIVGFGATGGLILFNQTILCLAVLSKTYSFYWGERKVSLLVFNMQRV
jgi:hypothetical protein